MATFDPASSASDGQGILCFADHVEDYANPGHALALDPILDASPCEHHQYFQLVYDNLVRRYNDSTAYEPGLAVGWQIIDDKTIAFQLRKDVLFQDGTPFDANAVKLGLERTRDLAGARLNALLENLENVEITSPHSLILRLNAPVAGSFFDMLTTVEGSIVSPTAVEAGVDLSVHPVGAGAYRVEEIGENPSAIRLRKWDGYWDKDAYKLDGIDFIHCLHGPDQTRAWESDDIDVVKFYTDNLVNGGLVLPEGRTLTGMVQLDCFDLEPYSTPDIVGDFYLGAKAAPIALSSLPFGGVTRITRCFAPGWIGNVGGYEHPYLQERLDKLALLTPVSEEAVETAKEAARFIMEQALFIPLYHIAWYWAWKEGVEGFKRLDGSDQHPDFQGVSKRAFHQGRPAVRRVLPRARHGRRDYREPVLHGQQLRIGDGPCVPRPRRLGGCVHGVRLHRRQACERSEVRHR